MIKMNLTFDCYCKKADRYRKNRVEEFIEALQTTDTQSLNSLT